MRSERKGWEKIMFKFLKTQQFELFEFMKTLEREKLYPITSKMHEIYIEGDDGNNFDKSFKSPLGMTIRLQYIEGGYTSRDDRENDFPMSRRKLNIYINGNIKINVFNSLSNYDPNNDDDPWLTIINEK
jgi:hypothetical protein